MWLLQTGQRQSEPGISLSLEERDMRRTWQTHWLQDAGVVSIALMSFTPFSDYSVRPSVRLSLKRVHCDKTEERYV